MRGTARILLPLVPLALFSASDAPQRLATTPQASWLAAVQANLAHAEYFVSGTTPQAPNRAQGIRTYFTPQGPRIVPREETNRPWEGSLTLDRYGCDDDLITPASAQPSIRDNRVDYRRGSLTEWYVNDEHGLEQGFTLSRAPAGDGRLEFDLAVGGTVEARVASNGQDICFVDTHGTPLLRISHLRTTDGRGSALASRFALTRGGHDLAIDVDATHAAYPVTIDPLLSSPGWMRESNLANAGFGLTVSTAGDVNGDGYSDIIVGAAAYDTGDPNGGQVTVYYGGPTGPATIPSWSAKDTGGTDGFGDRVATAGDVNGDGYSDILVGAPSTNSGQGEAYCWYGSASGLGANGTPANADWSVLGPQLGDQLGFSISCAGDVNKDGYADVIVGAPARDTGGGVHPGKALIYLGGGSGLSTSVYKEIDGTGNSYLGYSVCTAGDANNDGWSDVVIGAYLATGTAATSGLAYVYYGPGLTDAARTTLDPGSSSAYFGLSVSTAGDVDGDGYSDVIIGSPGYDLPSTDAGAIYVYKGGASGVSTSYTWRFVGTQASGRFGQSVSTAGDVNGDGYADVVVGWLRYTNGQATEGAACGWYGSSTGLKASGSATGADWLVESNNAGAGMGTSIACAGDVNGDGWSDVILGAQDFTNGQTNEGAAYVFFGSTAGLALPQWLTNGPQASAEYGYATTSGDFNGDGYSDIAISAPYYDNGIAYEGHVFVYNGGPSGPPASPSWQVGGDLYKGYVGFSLADAGDVNNDGYDDLLIGATGYSEGGLNAEGHAFAYYGSASGLTGSPSATLAQANWVARGNVSSLQFATSVGGAGDVNGDGYADVIIGTPYYANGQANEGGAFVYLGSASGLPAGATPASANWKAESNLASAMLGASVASAGDVNADGYSDVIVGAPTFTNTLAAQGAVFLWFGSATGLGANGTPANADWSDFGTEVSQDFGRSVAGIGDMNGDGFGDLVVGAPKNGAGDGGKATFYRGSATLPTFASSFAFSSVNRMGTQVGPAGDLNGDGFADAFASAPGFTSPDTSEGAVYIAYGGKTVIEFNPIQSNIAHAQMGSPSSAGDVNGDGFADLIVGLPLSNSNAGAAWLYYGGGRLNRVVHPRQRNRFNGRPLARLGMADSYRDVDLQHVCYSPFGNSTIRPEYELKPAGQPFDGTGIVQLGAIDLVTHPNFDQTIAISGLTAGASYHWRLRYRYDKGKQPYQPESRWIFMPLRGANDADVRMLPPSVVSAHSEPSGAVQLLGGTPNPFVGETTFRFSLPRAMTVKLGIYDVRGRLVRELINTPESAGWHTISWDGLAAGHEKSADGAYFARLETAEGKRMERVVLSR